MKKFNGFEKAYIQEALDALTTHNEDYVVKERAKGKRLLYAPGYFDMINKELKEKVNSMTLKKHQD